MPKSELRKLAIKSLNSKKMQSIKTQLCKQIEDKTQIKDCMTEFDKNFIKSFISSCQSKT